MLLFFACRWYPHTTLQDIKAAEDSAAVELAAMQQRYDAHKAVKEKEIQDMRNEFVAYHSKRRRQVAVREETSTLNKHTCYLALTHPSHCSLQEYRAEIDKLLRYAERCNLVLTDIENGYTQAKLVHQCACVCGPSDISRRIIDTHTHTDAFL